jgi:hypothetical protein
VSHLRNLEYIYVAARSDVDLSGLDAIGQLEAAE